MPEEKNPAPPKGQIVTTDSLQSALYASYRNTAAFGGARDPSSIWTSMVREDSRAILMYRELEDKDDDVSSSLDELYLSVAERTWTFTPGDDSSAALKACDFLFDQFANIDFDSALDSILGGCGYGFSVAECLYDTSEGQAALTDILDCPQELFLFGDRFTPQIGPLQYLDNPWAGSGALVPEEKFVIFTYRGRSRSRMGRPLLQKCFWPSWFKRQILGMWLKCGEKSKGTAIARYAEGATPEERALAVEIAENLVESSAIAVPIGFQYDEEMLKMGTSEKVQVYEKLFEKMQYSVARAIKGETLTSFGQEGGHGSRSQGQTHSETFEKRSVSLAKKVAAVLNDQLVRNLHLWNFGPDVAAPVFSFDVEEKKDLTAKAALYRNLQSMGVQFSDKFIRDEFDLPPIDTANDVALVPNAAIAPAPTPSSAFSEAQETADADYAALDLLTDQLRRDSLSAFRDRTEEIVSALKPGITKE